ncbi:hypothetical protein [Microbispora bryophytorum]
MNELAAAGERALALADQVEGGQFLLLSSLPVQDLHWQRQADLL